MPASGFCLKRKEKNHSADCAHPQSPYNTAMQTTNSGDPVVSAQIKKAGLKVTGPRMKILEIMERETTDNDRHLSAEDVYKILLKADEDIGLATVYRVLTQFEQAGILKRHNFEGNHSVFEIDNGDHHNHLICVKTGKVVEFYDPAIAKRLKEVAREYGYELEDHSLVLYGVYDEALAKSVGKA